MRKVINSLLTAIIGKNDVFTYEQQLVISYSLFSCIWSGIGLLANIGLKFSFFNILLVTLSFLVYLFNYVISRFFKKLFTAKWLFSSFTFLFCNFYWLVNFGSRGSAIYIFLAFYCVMIFIWDTKQIGFITLLVLANVATLLAIELHNPLIVPPYPTEEARIIDSYSFLLMIICIFSILIVGAKNNYIKQYKLAQQSDKLKSAFLANMSHEIRTPLNAVVGFSRLIAKRELSKEKKENYANLITENSNHLMQIVSDILDVSRIESGQLKVSFRPVNVNEMLERLYQNFKHLLNQLGKKDINLLTDIPCDPFIIETDGTRLEQIMSNLVNNAVKFTSEGYIKFGYYAEEDNIIFYIEDTGIGIKEKFQPTIFNRFVKNEEDAEIKFIRGTGIGLSLSKDLVELLGGKIWFSSSYQEGSIFYFSLPLNVAYNS